MNIKHICLLVTDDFNQDYKMLVKKSKNTTAT